MPFAGFPGQFVIVNISFVVINRFSTHDAFSSLRFMVSYGKDSGAVRPPESEVTEALIR